MLNSEPGGPAGLKQMRVGWQKDAKLEEGEEYIYEPSTFIVSFL